jgi:hypothetical protein
LPGLRAGAEGLIARSRGCSRLFRQPLTYYALCMKKKKKIMKNIEKPIEKTQKMV